MKLNRKNKKGFTIVELVIVIAVIGILSAILIPTFANLTTNAQEAAKKQQVADAYTAYLVEATDNKYDGLYKKVDEKYVEVSIAHKAQSGVSLKLGTEWFKYGEKGWDKYTPTATPSVFVVENAAKYYDANHVEKTDFTQEKASTFNGVVVYEYAA